MKLIVDMASIIQTGLKAGKDREAYTVNHDGKDVVINTAGHGYENAVDYLVHTLEFLGLVPSDMYMVFEGLDSKKKRLMIDNTYKSKRGKSAPEYYVEYTRCKDMVKAAFRSVGSIAFTQDLAEGDDTCAYLSAICEEDCVVLTNDVDLTVLAGTNRKGKNVRVLIGSDFEKLPKDVFKASNVSLFKTLVGDSSDSISGCPGFGPVMWLNFVTKYDTTGVDELSTLIDQNRREDVALFAKNNNCAILTKIVDNWNIVYRTWKLVKIYPEWVNTRYKPLQIEAGIVVDAADSERKRLSYFHHLPAVPDSRLRPFMQKRRLVTSENFEECLKLLQERVAAHPDEPVSLDIETSTNDESSDWMEAQGDPDGVDPIGSYLVGFSLTFGRGGNRTFYVSVNHHATANVSMSQARRMFEAVMGTMKPIHNLSFELTVLYNSCDEDGTPWREHWKNAGEYGFLCNVEDTLLMSSYVDENAMQRNLKALSRNVLGYRQTEFNEMRTFKLSDSGEKPWPGGRVVERTLKEPVMDNGSPVFDAKGKQKFATVKVDVPVLDEAGEKTFKRVRNKETGLMENVVKTQKVPVKYKEVVYKMHELPATAVFDYGCDDTICTNGYYRFAKLHMQIDEHYHVYRKVEIDAAYIHAKNYVDGFPISMQELNKQSKEDTLTRQKAEEVFFAYLTKNGWIGTVKPCYTKDITPAQVKEAYGIVMGISEADEEDEDAEEVDPVMAMRVRRMDKIVEFIKTQDRDGAAMFAWQLEQLLEGDEQRFNTYIEGFFDGRPKYAFGNKDNSKLLYDVMKMEVRVRNKATPAMKAAGIRQGNPKADALALAYAIADCTQAGREEELQVLKALQLITMVNTRFSLFYNSYPGFIHWRTGKVHSSHRQCHANTRRASSAKPNMQQQPVHAKIKGYESAFRRVVRPHKPGAVVVSLDFNAQELRSIADDSQDPNMLACYVGDNKKDMHSITGANIAADKLKETMNPIMEALAEQYADANDLRYYAFKSLEETNGKLFGEYRSLGKKVNFTTEYGAMAPKLAATLMVTESEAQSFIDAREEAFAVAARWKEVELIRKAHEDGFIRTRMGAKRHLAEMLDSKDGYIASKAERQAVNFRIQGSCAEQTKLAEGRMWRAGLFTGKYDAVCYGPVHDEVVSSVMLDQLVDFVIEKHACMVAKYADMQVPIVSSIAFGPNFYDQIEIGEEPTREAILAGIEKMKEKYPEEFA